MNFETMQCKFDENVFSVFEITQRHLQVVEESERLSELLAR